MLLLSLKESGKLYYDGVEADFVKELALIIDETEDDVMVTFNYLLKQGLIEQAAEDEYLLTEIASLIGSETDSARRSRKSRQQKVLQCSTAATLPGQDCSTEIEKEIEIESEKEEERKVRPSFYGEYKNIRLTDEEYQKLQEKLKTHAKTMIDKLSRYIESKGAKYNNHYATILNWYEQDRDKPTLRLKPKSYTIDDYEKGEYL